MKIFYFAYWHDYRFKKRPGGPPKVYDLCNNLKKLGHEVTLFIPKIGFPETQTTCKVSAINFLDFPILRFFTFQLFSFLNAFKQINSQSRPQVIIVRIMWSFLPMILGKWFHIPVILEINDNPNRGYELMSNPLKKFIVKWINQITYNLSDHFLAVTNEIANQLHKINNIPNNFITIVQSGTNTDLFIPLSKILCCEKLSFNDKNKYIGFTGTFFYYQGIDVLIDSASQIIKNFNNVCFLLVGEGPEKEKWEKRVSILGLQKYFLFTGYVPYNSVPYYCGVMDICVAPFLKVVGDSSPVKVYDYLSCGKPVVMSDIHQISYQFLGSNAIVLVEPENPDKLSKALSDLLIDPLKCRTMGRNGRSFIISEFDRTKLAKKIVQEIVKEKLGIVSR